MRSELAQVHDTASLETIECPYCDARECSTWGEELGFLAVRCSRCSLIYVNPRPSLALVDAAVKAGFHAETANQLNVVSRHSPRRVGHYRRILGRFFDDVWARGAPISWLDVGAGYGEIVDAVVSLSPVGSTVIGLEPMRPKADHAKARGLNVIEDYLRPGRDKVDFVSMVDVFSHIPRFDGFLDDVKSVLKTGGEIFVETGNLADVGKREDFPGELGLPDHLVFSGESHITGYLERGGFDVIRLERTRIDGVTNLAKNIVKRIIGRPVRLGLPYTSAYRQLLIRARCRTR